MIRNYIFDFGNVLTRFCPPAMTAACVPDAADAAVVCEAVFDRLYWDRLDDASITDDEVVAGFCSRLPQRLHAVACHIYDHWDELLTPIAGMPELAAEIKRQGGKLYLLSNISVGFTEKYNRVLWIRDLFALFDGLVFSGPLHIKKPDPAIFTYLLDRYGLQAEECLFIDDAPKNIDAAKQVGIQGYCFDGNADALRAALAKEGKIAR